MWPFLPKKCNCTETPNNPGTNCNHSGLTASDLIYDGIVGECSGITPGMTVSEILQQLSYFLCSVELTQYILDIIQDNPEEFPEFIQLVNGVISCETIDACGPIPTTTTSTTLAPTTTTTTSSSSTTTTTSSSSTTTTTTTVLDDCVSYTLQALVNNASWSAETCELVPTGGVITLAGASVVTSCIINNSLVLNQAIVLTETECTTTTTTTLAPTTTTTTTLAPTTTTTTTTEAVECYSYTFGSNDGTPIGFYYTPCFGTTTYVVLEALITVCCKYPPYPSSYPFIPPHAVTTFNGDC